ncbi:sensor histidine kinase [bacterium]|nr:sensor histidine kinase [bacterium]
MLQRVLKHNSILLTFFALYLIVLVLALLELDRQYYQNDKSSLIRENIYYLLDREVGQARIDTLYSFAAKDLQGSTPETRKALIDHMNGILDSKNFIYRIAIRTADAISSLGEGNQLITQTDSAPFAIDLSRDKFKAQNNWSNSLFLSNFTGLIEQDISDAAGKSIGRLTINYTTPLGYPRIEEMTARYRWYALFLAALLSVFAWGIAAALLFPMRNVMSALEASSAEHTTFIAKPGRRLEMFYNRMALDAVIARLQGLLRDQIALHPELTGWEIVRLVCVTFHEQVGTPLVAALEMVSEGPGAVTPTGQKVIAGLPEITAQAAAVAGQIDRALPRDGRTQASFEWSDDLVALTGILRLQSDPERGGIRYLFALGIDPETEAVPAGSLERMLERLVSLADGALQTLGNRNRLLVQERGRASISLSRNLGHDLTNIIATSKLELMALDRLLRSGQPPSDERRRGILVEALQGLLRSVRFMQETVNLYRAYAYLQHPVLETQDGNALVRETLELFEASISGRIDLRAELAEDAPRCVVDPRLIKLALFNLFTNALDATRRLTPNLSAPYAAPWICVRTRRADDGGLEIIVEDSGTGILNQSGQRAQPHEIEKIFELGYTNRRSSDSRGEGLGLNWVRTIVQDLHNGAITAENSETAGARFILHFAPLGKGMHDERGMTDEKEKPGTVAS